MSVNCEDALETNIQATTARQETLQEKFQQWNQKLTLTGIYFSGQCNDLQTKLLVCIPAYLTAE